MFQTTVAICKYFLGAKVELPFSLKKKVFLRNSETCTFFSRRWSGDISLQNSSESFWIWKKEKIPWPTGSLWAWRISSGSSTLQRWRCSHWQQLCPRLWSLFGANSSCPASLWGCRARTGLRAGLEPTALTLV